MTNYGLERLIEKGLDILEKTQGIRIICREVGDSADGRSYKLKLTYPNGHQSNLFFNKEEIEEELTTPESVKKLKWWYLLKYYNQSDLSLLSPEQSLMVKLVAFIVNYGKFCKWLTKKEDF